MNLNSFGFKSTAILAALGATVLGLSACSSGDDSSSSSAGGGNEASNITFAIGAPVLVDSTAPYASVPQDLGYWKDEGLTVDAQPTTGTTASMQLLLAGKADIANGGTSSFYQAAAKSPEVQVIYLQTKNIWQVTVPEGSEIEKIEDLEGETIGVQSLSSASYLFGRAAVAASDLDPDKDVKWLAVGVGAQAAQAIESGTVAAYASYDGPTGVISSVMGKELINLPTPLDKVPGLLGLATTKTFIKEHRDVLVKFLTGFNKGAVFSATNPGAALQIQWAKYPEQKPKDMSIEEAITATLPSVQTRYESGAVPGTSGSFGDVPMDDVQGSIDFMAKYGVLDESLKAKDVVDLSVTADGSKFDVDAIKKQAKDWKP